MSSTPYTLAMWKVKPGQQQEFVAAWTDLSAVFADLPEPPIEGTLLQSTADPHLYYSFGPWRSIEDISAMRGDPNALAAIERLRALCEEATPGSYQLVKHVTV